MPSTCHSLHWMSIRTTSFVHIIFRRLNEPVQSLETLSNEIQRWPVHHFRSVASPLAIRFPPNGIHHALRAHLKYSSLSSLIYFSFLSLSSLDLDAITNSFRTKYYPHFMLATFTTSNAMAVSFLFLVLLQLLIYIVLRIWTEAFSFIECVHMLIWDEHHESCDIQVCETGTKTRKGDLTEIVPYSSRKQVRIIYRRTKKKRFLALAISNLNGMKRW